MASLSLSLHTSSISLHSHIHLESIISCGAMANVLGLVSLPSVALQSFSWIAQWKIFLLVKSCGHVLLHRCGFSWLRQRKRCLFFFFFPLTLGLFENLLQNTFLIVDLNSTGFLHILYDPTKCIYLFLLNIPFRYPRLEKKD